jgi:signal peptidase
MIKKIIDFFSYVFTALLVFIIIISMFLLYYAKISPGKLPSISGYKAIDISSSSMEPFIHSGDLIISKNIKPEKIKAGDVITFRLYEGTQVTHRVVKVIRENKKIKFLTKGDANSKPDEFMVTPEYLEGVMKGYLFFGGKLIRLIQGDKGLAVFIVIPLFLLVRGELKNVLSDAGTNNMDEEDSIEAKT